MIKKIKGSLLPLSIALFIPLIDSVYFYLNNPNRGVHSLVTDIDKSIPFIKLFVIPYLIWYPFLLITLVYFCFYYRETYYKVIFSFIIGMLICYIIYYFFQTAVPRPSLFGNDYLTRLVNFIYSSDNQFNCFPSIHVLTCYIIIKGIKDSKKKSSLIETATTIVGVLIILSTQFIKQHVILDLIFAVLLGDAIYKIIGKFNLERDYLWIRKQFSWLMMRKRLET
jgi:hypothetical protein